MSLNHLEIDAILSELPLEGSHIQKVRQPDFSSLVFDLYRPKHRFSLLVSLRQGHTRLHRLTGKVPNKTNLQRFAQFLRSRVQGGRIMSAGQLGDDRIVKLLVRKGDQETILWIRLWGGASNIIATGTDGTVLDAFYRRPNRGELTGGSYDPERTGISGGGKKQFEIRDLPGTGGFNERIEAFYAELETAEELERVRTKAIRAAEEKLRAAGSLAANISRKLDSYESFEEFREYGDLLVSNLYRIKRGDEWFETENYYHGGKLVRIKLDPRVSPEQNAENYFKKYKKARRGLEILTEERENTASALQKAERDLERIRNSTDIDYLGTWIREYSENRPSRREDDGIPGLVYESGGFTLRVGRSSRENDTLLRKWAKGNDLWLHARDWPGAYVFVRARKGKSVPLDVLLDAGNLALHYSRGKSAGRETSIIPRSNISAGPGTARAAWFFRRWKKT